MGEGLTRALRVACSVVLLAAVSCSGSGSGSAEEDCGLPEPRKNVDASRVPEEFLLEGTEVRKVTEGKDLDVFALNVPHSVTEAYDLYRAALRPPRYEMITHENEVFEMEIYLRRRNGTFVAVQARRPRCDHSSSVFVTLSRRE